MGEFVETRGRMGEFVEARDKVARTAEHLSSRRDAAAGFQRLSWPSGHRQFTAGTPQTDDQAGIPDGVAVDKAAKARLRTGNAGSAWPLVQRLDCSHRETAPALLPHGFLPAPLKVVTSASSSASARL